MSGDILRKTWLWELFLHGQLCRGLLGKWGWAFIVDNLTPCASSAVIRASSCQSSWPPSSIWLQVSVCFSLLKLGWLVVLWGQKYIKPLMKPRDQKWHSSDRGIPGCHWRTAIQQRMHAESQHMVSSASGLPQNAEWAFTEAGTSLDSERKQAWAPLTGVCWHL